ncbi:MAG TPA: hypothetical protein VFT22_16140 [Kofleriaceae bacterium]|nr:hypothetical protein [Kofleriaceae bacterium]
MPSDLTDKARQPDDAALRAVLGKAKPHRDAIIAAVEPIPGVVRERKFYAGGHGWQLKLRDRTAALAYLIRHAGSVLAALPLSDPAVAALADSDVEFSARSR